MPNFQSTHTYTHTHTHTHTQWHTHHTLQCCYCVLFADRFRRPKHQHCVVQSSSSRAQPQVMLALVVVMEPDAAVGINRPAVNWSQIRFRSWVCLWLSELSASYHISFPFFFFFSIRKLHFVNSFHHNGWSVDLPAYKICIKEKENASFSLHIFFTNVSIKSGVNLMMLDATAKKKKKPLWPVQNFLSKKTDCSVSKDSCDQWSNDLSHTTLTITFHKYLEWNQAAAMCTVHSQSLSWHCSLQINDTEIHTL